MASISCQHIYKIYPGATAPSVTDFNLEIQDKEFIIFVGPSGCGKSTTLRMIAGLEEISGGEMYIGDRLINDVPPKDRDIAMVFQSYALYPHMTVYDNMAFGLKLKKMPKEEYVKQMDDKKTAMTKAVTSLFYKGLTVAQIAEELHISKRTVISRKNDAKKFGWIPFRGKFFEKSLCWTA